MKVAFIGMGTMGVGMALNILKAVDTWVQRPELQSSVVGGRAETCRGEPVCSPGKRSTRGQKQAGLKPWPTCPFIEFTM